MLQRLQQEYDALFGILLLQKLSTSWVETDRSYKEFSSHSLWEKPEKILFVWLRKQQNFEAGEREKLL